MISLRLEEKGKRQKQTSKSKNPAEITLRGFSYN